MMKVFYFKYAVVFLCFTLMCVRASGQCDSIILSNQRDVNNFIKNYGHCTTIKDLIIQDKEKDIVSLDSLYRIQRITRTLYFQDFPSFSEINISSFQSLRYIGYILNYPPVQLIGQFPKVDTVKVLRSVYYGDYELGFSYYPQLKHIDSSLTVFGQYIAEVVPEFTTGQNFDLQLEADANTVIIEILSKRIKTADLRRLTLFPGSLGTKGIDLSKLTILDSVEYLRLSSCTRSNLSQLSTIRNLKDLHIDGYFSNNNWGPGLVHVRELNTLSINSTRYSDFKQIFPNLEAINRRLSVALTDSLFNLDFLDNVRPPLASTPLFINSIYPDKLILMDNNLRLQPCKSLFLCRAAQRYPDRILLEKNAGFCTLESLIKYCNTITVGTEEELGQGLQLSPNPTTGILYISETDEPIDIKIWNMQGVPVKKVEKVRYEVDISSLPEGMYILEVAYKGKRENYRIIKMDI